MRRRVVRTALAAVAVLALIGSIAGPAHAAEYTFTVVADSADGPTPDGCPAINNLGQVAFNAQSNSGAQAILRGNGAGTTVIVRDTGQYDFIGVNPSINDRGTVSFAANLDNDGEAILKGRGGPLTTIAETEPGPFNFFGFDTSINNRGRVAFSAEIDNFDEGRFSGGGGPIRTYYLASTSQFGGSDSRPSINDFNDIAFFDFVDGGGTGVFKSAGDGFVTIAGEELSPDRPSLNNVGLVAFTAAFVEGEEFVEAIMTGDGGPVTTVADTTGPFSFFDAPSLNNAGEVAFAATLDGGREGVFFSSGALLEKVIATGDPLAGSTVTGVHLCAEGLNDRGQLGFQAQLQDGRTVVARATRASGS